MRGRGGAFIFDKKGICRTPAPSPPLQPVGSHNNAPTGTWVSPQLKKSQERERSLLHVLDRELNGFFPQAQKEREREEGMWGSKGGVERETWRGERGRKGGI